MKKDNNWFLQIEIDSLNSLIEIVDYSMFPTFRKWQEKHKNKDNISEYDQVSQCVLQSMISKAKTLQLASNGFSIRDIKTKIIDISSMASIMRNILLVSAKTLNPRARARMCAYEKKIRLTSCKVSLFDLLCSR